MIIFESFLTTFEAGSIFEAAGAVTKIGSSIKSNHHNKVNLVQIPDTQTIFFLLPKTRLFEQSFEATRVQQALALTPLALYKFHLVFREFEPTTFRS